MNSKFGKPSSFCPWATPSFLLITFPTTHTTSSHVNVDVNADNAPLSILNSISFAFFTFGCTSTWYSTGYRNTFESTYAMSPLDLFSHYFFDAHKLLQFNGMSRSAIFRVNAFNLRLANDQLVAPAHPT